MHTNQGQRSPIQSVLLVSVVVPLFLAIALLVFVWPASNLEPRDLPIGVVGSPEQITALAGQLGNVPGSIDVTRYPDEAAATTGIRNREVYGAIVLDNDSRPRILIASAASPAVAQVLQGLAAGTQPAPANVVDIVPGTPSDPRATAFASALFPLLAAGMLTGLLSTAAASTTRTRLAAAAGTSIIGGIVAVTMIQTWLDLIGGNWLVNAGVYSLIIFAIGATIAGLNALWGMPGTAMGGLTIFFLGNAWSGVTSAPEMLPSPLGAIGQWLPPGAGASLLRGTAFFEGAGTTMPLAILVIWSMLGAAAIILAGMRSAGKIVDDSSRTA